MKSSFSDVLKGLELRSEKIRADRPTAQPKDLDQVIVPTDLLKIGRKEF